MHREVLVDSVVMTDWQMVVETWADGRHSFPKFTRDSTQPPGPKRFTTTVRLRAGAARTVHLRGPRRAVGHRRTQHRSRRGQEPRLRRHREVHRRHRDHPAVPADADGHARLVHDRWRRRCGSPGSTCCRMARAPTSRATIDMAHWPEQTWNVKSRGGLSADARDLLRARDVAAGRRGPFRRRTSISSRAAAICRGSSRATKRASTA